MPSTDQSGDTANLFKQMAVSGPLRFDDAAPEKGALVFNELPVFLRFFKHGFLIPGNVDHAFQTGNELILEIMLAQLAEALLSIGIELIETGQFFGNFGNSLMEIFGVSHKPDGVDHESSNFISVTRPAYRSI